MDFIDTSIFLRLLTREDEQKAQTCLQLFKNLENSQIEAIIGFQ